MTGKAKVSRSQFEAKLLEDERLRTLLGQLREVGEQMDEAEKLLKKNRQAMNEMVYDLVKAGAPLTLLAELVGLTQPRISQIVREMQQKLRRSAGRTTEDALREGMNR